MSIADKKMVLWLVVIKCVCPKFNGTKVQTELNKE